MSKQLLD